MMNRRQMIKTAAILSAAPATLLAKSTKSTKMVDFSVIVWQDGETMPRFSDYRKLVFTLNSGCRCSTELTVFTPIDSREFTAMNGEWLIREFNHQIASPHGIFPEIPAVSVDRRRYRFLIANPGQTARPSAALKDILCSSREVQIKHGSQFKGDPSSGRKFIHYVSFDSQRA